VIGKVVKGMDKREADTHFWQLCADAEGVLKNAANKDVGCKLIAKFLGELFDHLPKTMTAQRIQCSKGNTDCERRNHAHLAFARQAKRVRMTLNAERDPKGGARKRIRKVGADLTMRARPSPR
jgi:hypothetical protein